MTPRRIAVLALIGVLGAVVAFALWNLPGSAPSGPGDAGPEPGAPSPAAANAVEAAGGGKADHAAGQEATDTPARTELDAGGPRFAVRGKLLGKSGLPVAGVIVLAYAGTRGDRRGAVQALFASMAQMSPGREPKGFGLQVHGDALGEARVGPDGSFRIAGLRQRHLRLALDHDFYGLHEPAPAAVPEGESEVDVGVLEPYLGARLSGRVLGPGAQGGSSVHLLVEPDPMSVMREPNAFMGIMMKAGSLVTPVDENGQFLFRAVWPSPRMEVLLRSDAFCGHTEPFSLAAGEVREVVLPTTRAAAVAVSVVDADGQPIARARVQVVPDAARGDITRSVTSRRERTGEDGSCTVRGLRGGLHRITVSASGFTGAASELEVVAAAEPQEVRLVLGVGGIVTGTVVDQEGAPVAGAHVAHVPSIEVPVLGDLVGSLGTDLLAKSAWGSNVTTDAAGRFRVSGLEDPGKFHLAAVHEDFVGGMADGVRMGDEDVVIELARGATVIGRALAAENGDPLADFEVESSTTMFGLISRPSRIADVRDAEDGRFELSGVPPGSFRLLVRAEGRSEVSQRVRAEGGASVDVGDVELPRGAIVRGVVRDENGAAVVGASVRPKQGGLMDNPIMASMFGTRGTRSGERGEFTLDGLPGGRLILSANANGYASGRSERLRVAPGESLDDVVIVLGHGGSIAGSLLLPAGMSTDGWEVVPNRGMSGGVAWVDIDPDGTFRIDNLDPGRYDVQAFRMAAFAEIDERQKRDWRPGKGFDFGEMMSAMTEQTILNRCVVKAGEETEVVLDGRDLDLPQSGLVIEVLVGGAPLDAGWAEVSYQDGSRTLTGFIQNGELALAHVHPGQLRVQIRGGITMTPIGEPQFVDYPESETVHRTTIELPGAEIRGRVLDASSGEPLRGALVKLVNQDRASRSGDDPTDLGFALSDDEGAFRFRGLVEGTYALLADNQLFRAAGEAASASRLTGVRVTGDQIVDGVELRARPGAGVTVLVTGDAGAPLAGTMLAAVDAESRPVGSLGLSFAGGDGRAHLGGLPGGRVRIVGRAPGYAPGVTELQEVQPGLQTEFHLALERGTRVRLRPVDAEGQPLTGAVVSARLGSGPWIPASLLVLDRSDGELDLGPLPRGAWQFQVFHPRTGAFTATRSVGAGSAVSLTVAP